MLNAGQGPGHSDGAQNGGTSRLPGAWYVTKDRQLSGPFSGEQMLELTKQSLGDFKDYQACLSGFKQWYPLFDILSLLRQLDAFDGSQESLVRSSHFPPRPHYANPQQLETRFAPHLSSVAATFGETLTPTSLTIGEVTLAVRGKQVGANTETSSHLIAHLEKQTGILRVVSTPETRHRATSGGLDSPTTSGRPLSGADEQLLLSLLRCGSPRSAAIVALLHLPFCLLGFWIHWYREARAEIQRHVVGDGAIPCGPPLWLAMTPVFHIYMSYHLAWMLMQAERQNKYRGTSPGLAAILAVFPPLAAFYIQWGINNHWKLHEHHTYLSEPMGIAPTPRRRRTRSA